MMSTLCTLIFKLNGESLTLPATTWSYLGQVFEHFCSDAFRPFHVVFFRFFVALDAPQDDVWFTLLREAFVDDFRAHIWPLRCRCCKFPGLSIS